MEKYFALFAWENETGSGGATIFYDTPQTIAESIIEHLELYIDDDLFYDGEELERALKFIENTKNKRIDIADIEGYSCELGIGYENIRIVGTGSAAIVEIAKELFGIMTCYTFDDRVNADDFDPNNHNEYLDDKELLCYQLYQIGMNEKLPDQELLDKIELACIR